MSDVPHIDEWPGHSLPPSSGNPDVPQRMADVQRVAPQLVGRATEFVRLAGLVDRTVEGCGGIAIIEGEPGIGKTALLDAAVTAAISRGMRVFRGSTTVLDSRLPFAAIRSCRLQSTPLVEPDVVQASSLLDQENLPGQNVFDQQLSVIEAAVTVIDYWCSRGPVAVFVDDVHWADPSSLVVLGRLAEMVTDLPLAMVLAVSRTPADGDAMRLADRLGVPDIERLRLNQLGEREVHEMVTQLVGAPLTSTVATEVAASAGGNPLYVTLLAQALADERMGGHNRSAPSDLDPATRAGLAVPNSLIDTVVRRLRPLPSLTQRVLSLAAVLESRIEAVELSAVLSAPIVDVWAALSLAVDAGVLVRTGDHLTFQHDVVRQVLADQVPAATRTALQHRAAQVLIATDAPVERIAALLLISGAELGQQSVSWLIESNDRLIRRVPELAVTLFTRALSTARPGASQNHALQVAHTRALLWIGEAAQAETAARAYLINHPPDTQGRNIFQWLILQATYARGMLPEAMAAAETALTQPRITVRERCLYQGFLALSYFFGERFDLVETMAAQAIANGQRCGEPVGAGLGYTALGGLYYTRGNLDQALTFAERIAAAHEDCRRLGNVSAQLDPHALHAHSLIELDRFEEAESVLKLAVVRSRNNRGMHLVSLARLYFLEGRWDDALAEIQARQGLPDIFGHGLVTTSLTTLIHIHRGVYQASVDTTLKPDERVGSQTYLHFESWVAALLLEGQGRPTESLRILSEASDQLRTGLSAATIYYAYPDLARLAALTDNNEMAIAVAGAAQAFDTQYSTPSRRGTALLCRGLAIDNPDLLERAADEFRAAARPWYEGQARENLAVLLARVGRDDEARSALDAALDIYEELQAQWDVSRAESRLREFGIRRTRRHIRLRPTTGWDSLTPTEHRVAMLVVEGRSNSDIAATMFLSRRTVQSHVSSILAKLEVNSRVQVAVGFPPAS
ncbi:MAG: helix-turn-helix transcriptional regulator [Nocardia sp.]|uniref:helix-turn-helix transcriptional regulator n=1 Tax=Nocardia sp. TaxID=1821 RepID=UPI0026315E0B|nr:AAA family ATPase [Nocardia sp.]MCU1646229.1 helix-turn-helix transcriptional regulator [Nocardia sp.]